ncbi:S8 family serine peptidase [Actinoallomurus sp. CA-150999]|uniref:S8 family serine peptidase n=1 Tax=Actinoallomurus sp. CA-150999 TaxID=3239887 RepID=UPI003D89D74F
MRRLIRSTLAAALVSLTALGVGPTAAAASYPAPLENEWWFTTWELQQKVWPVSQGDGVTVAVIDSGVQADLPELRGVVLPGSDSTGGGDGRTDSETGPTGGHGTAMAALIAAQGGPTRFLGAAPRSKILPVDIHTSSAAIAPGIRFAVDHGAKVINISQTVPGQCPDVLQRAVGYAIDHDVVVVAAAGNDGQADNPSEYPANCAGVLAVGGVSVSGQNFVPFAKTERQPYVAVAAPAGQVGSVLKDGQFHTSEGGTSSAAALTSATVALVRAKHPDMHAREVVQRIVASCLDVAPSGRDDRTGYGLLRPMHALSDTVSKDAPNPVFAAYEKWKSGQGGSTGQSPGSEPTKTPSSRRSATELTLMALIPIILIAAVVALIVRARRGRTRRPAPTPGPSEQARYQDPRHGPPPSFGPTETQEPPRDGSRPTFEPPDHGPPAGHGR